MKNTCKKCIWFGDAIFCCFHPINEGIRAFPDTDACDSFRDSDEGPLTEEELNNVAKLFIDDNEDYSM